MIGSPLSFVTAVHPDGCLIPGQLFFASLLPTCRNLQKEFSHWLFFPTFAPGSGSSLRLGCNIETPESGYQLF
jgi:hypothetical protein